MSIVRTGADVTAGAVGAELDADPDTLVDLIFAICAIPAAVTAAACIPPIIAPIGGGIVAAACMNAPTAPSVTSAPVRTMDIQQVRSVTSASEEDRLNQMASDQRVVLVMSDLEVKQNQSRVQVAEASF